MAAKSTTALRIGVSQHWGAESVRSKIHPALLVPKDTSMMKVGL